MASPSCHRRKPISYSYSHCRRAPLLLCAFLAAVLHLHPVKAQYATIDGHSCFRNLDGMMQSMFDLAQNNPELVTIEDIGDGYVKSSGSSNNDFDLPDEGYDIYAMAITASDSPYPSSDKGKTLFTSGVHAREYAPPELAMRYAESLVDGYNVDSDITWLLQHTEIHFIIYVNPEGRYVAENDRELYWRKNLNPSQCSSSDEYGVDINRNFDFVWGDPEGASDDPCDSDYHGRSAESEPETQAVVNYAKALFPVGQRKDDPEGSIDDEAGEEIMGMFADIHSSGGYVYYPWGHKDEFSPDDDALQALGRKLAFFNDYRLWAPGSPDFLYPASGDASDYMYGVLSVASFGLELGEDFYEDCGLFEDEVVPINLPALLYASKISKRPFHLIKGPDILELEITSDNVQDDQREVTVVASDSTMVQPHSTGDQGVAKVQLYLDVHPDDYNGNSLTWEIMPTDGNSESQTISMQGVSSGRHVLYAQAIDNDGYLGPVSSVFFDVERAETASPSSKPSVAPTSEPTSTPSQAPSGAPTGAPTEAPTTAMPTKTPTQTPSVTPETANPTANPTTSPTSSPTTAPSTSPSKAPSGQPTPSPSSAPSDAITSSPTSQQTMTQPTNSPSSSTTPSPTKTPSAAPSNQPTSAPSPGPTPAPVANTPPNPTDNPTTSPSTNPTSSPTQAPAGALVPEELISPDDSASTVARSSLHFLAASVLLVLYLG